jgi:uncharacterized membrane protein
MNSLLLNHDPLIRLGFFLGILVSMTVWELLAPRRCLQTSKSVRWFDKRRYARGEINKEEFEQKKRDLT